MLDYIPYCDPNGDISGKPTGIAQWIYGRMKLTGMKMFYGWTVVPKNCSLRRTVLRNRVMHLTLGLSGCVLLSVVAMHASAAERSRCPAPTKRFTLVGRSSAIVGYFDRQRMIVLACRNATGKLEIQSTNADAFGQTAVVRGAVIGFAEVIDISEENLVGLYVTLRNADKRPPSPAYSGSKISTASVPVRIVPYNAFTVGFAACTHFYIQKGIEGTQRCFKRNCKNHYAILKFDGKSTLDTADVIDDRNVDPLSIRRHGRVLTWRHRDGSRHTYTLIPRSHADDTDSAPAPEVSLPPYSNYKNERC